MGCFIILFSTKQKPICIIILIPGALENYKFNSDGFYVVTDNLPESIKDNTITKYHIYDFNKYINNVYSFYTIFKTF